jgi:hypothetical protein
MLQGLLVQRAGFEFGHVVGMRHPNVSLGDLVACFRTGHANGPRVTWDWKVTLCDQSSSIVCLLSSTAHHAHLFILDHYLQ